MAKKDTNAANKPKNQDKGNHGANNEAKNQEAQSRPELCEEGCDHDHGDDGPSKIPFYVVCTLITSAIAGYILSHILESRSYMPEFSLFSTDTPPNILSSLPSQLYPLKVVLTYIYFFTPFSSHSFTWITFISITTLLISSLYMVNTTDPGTVIPDAAPWAISTLQAPPPLPQPGFVPLPLTTTIERKSGGSIRLCRKTHCIKPDRAHYCHATKRLVHKLDHYCIFIDATVGYNNYKFFILFLGYLISLGLFISTKLWFPLQLSRVISSSSSSSLVITPHIIIAGLTICLSLACSFAVLLFSLFHFALVYGALTTIEQNEKVNKYQPSNGSYFSHPYNIDLVTSLIEVFGYDIKMWLLPVPPQRLSHEDGTYYLTNYRYMPTSQRHIYAL